ncbi:DNA-binding NarL/FixJ family response regulator [Alkalibacillus flavidus]|uniref:DNA-binding NarL/FixJ family response regulator n=1 Tax=Alkalibacillus flavidus TaxID=546021 RepID=A0ABV2KV76_9BACI
MSYQHLTTFERARIETMIDQGLSLRQIGKKLKRAASTISRVLNVMPSVICITLNKYEITIKSVV